MNMKLRDRFSRNPSPK